MSGAEVAGLVLGAIPLLISALEHWQTTSAVVAKWWHVRTKLKGDIERLEDARVLYSSHLEELLQPLVVDGVVTKAEFEAMRRKLADKMWNENKVQLALRQRLADRYDRYIATVLKMDNSIRAYAEILCESDPVFQAELMRRWPPVDSNSNNMTTTVKSGKRSISTSMHFEGRRLKYSLPSKRRDELLEEIDRCLDVLQQFLDSSDRISKLVAQQSSFRGQVSSATLARFWTHADAVFQLIGDAWQCQCKRYHCVCLWLKHRTSDAVDLKIQLRYCHGTAVSSPSWLRRTAQVKLAASCTRSASGPLVTVQAADPGQTKLMKR